MHIQNFKLIHLSSWTDKKNIKIENIDGIECVDISYYSNSAFIYIRY